jgi:hypothetical protein
MHGWRCHTITMPDRVTRGLSAIRNYANCLPHTHKWLVNGVIGELPSIRTDATYRRLALRAPDQLLEVRPLQAASTSGGKVFK